VNDSPYRPVALTAALTGGDVLPSQTPYLPKGAAAIADAAVAAAEAGATCVHIHGRDEQGRPSADPKLFEQLAGEIRSRSDVVLNITTGGAPGMTVEERLVGVRAVKPEIATFNLGTMNYEPFPHPDRWPQVESDWERAELENTGNGTFVNTLATLRLFGSTLAELGVTPELEAYDLGHLNMARFLLDEGTLVGPVRVQLVLGVLGAAGKSVEDIALLVSAARRILGDDLGALGVAAVGFPAEFRAAAFAFSLGMDCRVGLEDNLRVRRDRAATSNAELVEVAVTLADALGRPIEKPDELRARLGPWAAGRGSGVAS
jgi:uncharacterized protein (DUF849 family)